MKTILLAAVPALLLAGCSNPTPSASAAVAKPKATPNVSIPTHEELKDRLDKAATVYHAGCQDEEKSSCKDPTRTCRKGIEKVVKSALKKEVAIEWEAPRETWDKNEGVLDHYWFVNADGSGDYYYLLPSPDDVQTDCGGEYCGWHKETVAAGTLYSAGKLHLVPHKDKEIADLDFCPPPPKQAGFDD